MKLAGDKGYSYPRIRRWLRRHGIQAVIPRRKDQRPDDGRVQFDRGTYKRRAVVEQCVGWLKESRAVATRFDTYDVQVNRESTAYCRAIRKWPAMAEWTAAAKAEPAELEELDMEF